MARLRILVGFVAASFAAGDADCSASGSCAAPVAAEREEVNALLQTVARPSGNLQLDQSAGSTTEPINICYFTNWARYRSGLINTGKDVFEMGLAGNICTHIMYGFATVYLDTDGTFKLKSNDPNADHPSGSTEQETLCPTECEDPNHTPACYYPCSRTRPKRGYEGVTVDLKKKNPNVKGLISVGGWNFNDCHYNDYGQGAPTCEIFSTIAADEEKTKAFAANIIAFCRNWGFDGFDLDWEYPVVVGHNDNTTFGETPQDYDNYINMLRLLKAEFVAENPENPLLLTGAMGVGKATVEKAYNIPKMTEHMDLINLMTYDLHGGWEPRTGCNANLYATEADIANGGAAGSGDDEKGYPLSVSWAVDYWIEKGAAPSKLTMGLATYGRGWKLKDLTNTSYGAPTTGTSTPGVSTGEAGYLSYYEVQDKIKTGQATRYYDNDRKCPYIVTTDGEWIGYDDEESWQAKLDFARSRNLAGTMIWALDLDDFAGAYGNGKKYPLVSMPLSDLAPSPTTTPTPSPPTTPAPTPATTTPTPTPNPAPTTTTPTPTPTPAGECIRNTDCDKNPWCHDAGYDAWCKNMGNTGSCPSPQCVQT